jgi:cytidylate kinase
MQKGQTRGLVITVSGPHGTGKSTYAKSLADALGLRYISAGEIFRDLARERKMSLEALSKLAAGDPAIDQMLDERTKSEARKGAVVIDAQLGAWMARDLVDLKVFLTAPDDVRFRRIAEREGVTLQEARKETEYRESNQRKRYKEYYEIDVSDMTIYDIQIDTSNHSIEETKRIVIATVRRHLKELGKLGVSR